MLLCNVIVLLRHGFKEYISLAEWQCHTSGFVSFENTQWQKRFVVIPEQFKVIHCALITVAVTG
jgi:hypothetical protein